MRLSFLSLQIALLLVACNAAPVYRELSIEARDDLTSSSLDVRDDLSSNLLDVRDDDFMEDGIVARAYPGPGMRHKLESNPPKTGFNPVPSNQYFKTPTNVYRGQQVNNAAQGMLNNLHSAPTYSSSGKNRLKSYPKPSTGFRDSEHANPAKNDGTNVAYHAPIGGPARPTVGRHGSMKVGSDRVVAHRKTTDNRHSVGVSYHDPRKPIPPAQPNKLQSNNHPFSMAQPKNGGAVKAAGAKAGVKISNAAKKITSPFKKKRG